MKHASPQTFKRICLALLTVGVVTALIELACLIWPSKHQMDNPWYTMVGHDAMSASPDLPFERPAHFSWTGSSRGDLAVLHGDRDPYAKRVTFKTDYQGFRNDTDIREADIVFIGDSYIEAGNVDFEKGVVQLVGARLGKTVRNLGRAVYAPPHELVVLKKYGLPCKPKLVIWQIAESNDLNESLGFEQWRQSGKPFFESQGLGRLTRKDAWRRRSPTQRLLAMFKGSKSYPLSGNFTASDGRSYSLRFLPRLPGREQTPRGHPGMPIMARALDEGVGMLKELDIPLIVVMVPMKYHVMGDFVDLADHTRENMQGYRAIDENERMTEQLRVYCQILEVPFVDATPALKAATAEGELVYIPFDTHLSEHGHEIVAELIVQAIRSNTAFESEGPL